MAERFRFKNAATGNRWDAAPRARLKVYRDTRNATPTPLLSSDVRQDWQSMSAGDLAAVLRDDDSGWYCVLDDVGLMFWPTLPLE